MKQAFISASNPAAKKYGMTLTSAPMETNAEMLFAPSLQFAQNVSVEPGREGNMNWRGAPNNRRFVVPGSAKRWLVINYMRCCDASVLR